MPSIRRSAGSIGAICLVSFAAFACGFQLASLREALLDSPQRAAGDALEQQTAHVTAGLNGHFVARVTIAGQQVPMVIDSGAQQLTLPFAVTERLGIAPPAAAFTRTLPTANGVARFAEIGTGPLRVGGLRIAPKTALVAPPGLLKRSLLGMDVLKELGTVKISGNELTIHRSRRRGRAS